MKRLFVLAALLIGLTGCLHSPILEHYNKLIQGRFEAHGGVINCASEGYPLPPDVIYKSYDVLMAEHDQRAAVEMWTPAELQEHRSVTPVGGILLIATKGTIIDDAEPEGWRVVVEADGKRITDKFGNKKLPFYNQPFWMSTMAVSINERPRGPMMVYIIKKGAPMRLECTVTPTSVASSL